jgi:hypothetical protein
MDYVNPYRTRRFAEAQAGWTLRLRRSPRCPSGAFRTMTVAQGLSPAERH